MKPFKSHLARLILWFLGRGICACALLDSRAKAEVQDWPEGVRLVLEIAPAGPAVSLEKWEGHLRFLGTRTVGEADLLITFKQIEAALPILLGMKSIAQGYAERRMTMKGDLAFAMSVVRVILLVEAYLFPGLITRRIMQRVPAREVSMARVYLAALVGS